MSMLRAKIILKQIEDFGNNTNSSVYGLQQLYEELILILKQEDRPETVEFIQQELPRFLKTLDREIRDDSKKITKAHTCLGYLSHHEQISSHFTLEQIDQFFKLSTLRSSESKTYTILSVWCVGAQRFFINHSSKEKIRLLFSNYSDSIFHLLYTTFHKYSNHSISTTEDNEPTSTANAPSQPMDILQENESIILETLNTVKQLYIQFPQIALEQYGQYWLCHTVFLATSQNKLIRQACLAIMDQMISHQHWKTSEQTSKTVAKQFFCKVRQTVELTKLLETISSQNNLDLKLCAMKQWSFVIYYLNAILIKDNAIYQKLFNVLVDIFAESNEIVRCEALRAWKSIALNFFDSSNSFAQGNSTGRLQLLMSPILNRITFEKDSLSVKQEAYSLWFFVAKKFAVQNALQKVSKTIELPRIVFLCLHQSKELGIEFCINLLSTLVNDIWDQLGMNNSEFGGDLFFKLANQALQQFASQIKEEYLCSKLVQYYELCCQQLKKTNTTIKSSDWISITIQISGACTEEFVCKLWQIFFDHFLEESTKDSETISAIFFKFLFLENSLWNQIGSYLRDVKQLFLISLFITQYAELFTSILIQQQNTYLLESCLQFLDVELQRTNQFENSEKIANWIAELMNEISITNLSKQITIFESIWKQLHLLNFKLQKEEFIPFLICKILLNSKEERKELIFGMIVKLFSQSYTEIRYKDYSSLLSTKNEVLHSIIQWYSQHGNNSITEIILPFLKSSKSVDALIQLLKSYFLLSTISKNCILFWRQIVPYMCSLLDQTEDNFWKIESILYYLLQKEMLQEFGIDLYKHFTKISNWNRFSKRIFELLEQISNKTTLTLPKVKEFVNIIKECIPNHSTTLITEREISLDLSLLNNTVIEAPVVTAQVQNKQINLDSLIKKNRPSTTTDQSAKKRRYKSAPNSPTSSTSSGNNSSSDNESCAFDKPSNQKQQPIQQQQIGQTNLLTEAQKERIRERKRRKIWASTSQLNNDSMEYDKEEEAEIAEVETVPPVTDVKESLATPELSLDVPPTPAITTATTSLRNTIQTSIVPNATSNTFATSLKSKVLQSRKVDQEKSSCTSIPQHTSPKKITNSLDSLGPHIQTLFDAISQPQITVKKEANPLADISAIRAEDCPTDHEDDEDLKNMVKGLSELSPVNLPVNPQQSKQHTPCSSSTSSQSSTAISMVDSLKQIETLLQTKDVELNELIQSQTICMSILSLITKKIVEKK